MSSESTLRGWPIFWDDSAQAWRFCDTGEPTVENWSNRPCGHCGLYGNSSDGDVDPCLGVLPGVTNACCGHGNPDEAYICFMGGMVIRGFDITELHHRQLSEQEQNLIAEHNQKRQAFRELRSANEIQRPDY